MHVGENAYFPVAQRISNHKRFSVYALVHTFDQQL